jgi:hypothetical protein
MLYSRDVGTDWYGEYLLIEAWTFRPALVHRILDSCQSPPFMGKPSTTRLTPAYRLSLSPLSPLPAPPFFAHPPRPSPGDPSRLRDVDVSRS